MTITLRLNGYGCDYVKFILYMLDFWHLIFGSILLIFVVYTYAKISAHLLLRTSGGHS